MEHKGYERLKQIGKGAFGAAVLCRKTRTGQLYVAKEVNLASMKVAEKQEAKNEIKVLAKLDHPNVTKFIDAFEVNHILYIVMEYADGGDLWAKVQSQAGKRIPEELVLHYFVQLCLALHHMHTQKVLHRDLKCANVFLTSNNVVKLGDFGISTVLQHTMSMARTKCGTPYYFSPEICHGRPYDYKSDVWALGCILYELCALRHAFNGQSMTDLLQRITTGKYDPLSNIYSSDLRQLVGEMLSLDVTRRPSVDQILSLQFLQTSIRRIIDSGAADPCGPMDHQACALNRQRYFKESERLMDENDAKMIAHSREALRKKEFEERRAAERKEAEEAIERIKQQVQHLKQLQERLEVIPEHVEEDTDDEGPPPAATPTSGQRAKVAGPPNSRAAKAALGEQIMDLMLKQQKIQEALDRGLDPEELERQEEQARQEAEAQELLRRQQQRIAAKEKAEKEHKQFLKAMAKQKAMQRVNALLEAGLDGLSGDEHASPVISPLPGQDARRDVEANDDVIQPEQRAEVARKAQLQAALDRQRARLHEMERKLALERRAREEVKQEEDRLRADWQARGWNIAILEEQFQERQLERIRARYLERQEELGIAAQPASTDPLSPPPPTQPTIPPLPSPQPPPPIHITMQVIPEDRPPPLTIEITVSPSPAGHQLHPVKGESNPMCSPPPQVLDGPKGRALIRAEEETRKRLESIQQQQVRTMMAQIRKQLMDFTSRMQLQAMARESGCRQVRTQANRQRQLEEQAEQRAGKQEGRLQRMQEAQLQRQEQEQREKKAEADLQVQQDLVRALEQERDKRPSIVAKGTKPPGTVPDSAVQMVICNEHDPANPYMVRKVTFAADVVNWLDDLPAGHAADTDARGVGQQHAPALAPRSEHRRERAALSRFAPSIPLGDMTGVITVISARPSTAPTELQPPTQMNSNIGDGPSDLSRVHRPSAQKRRLRRVSATPIPGTPSLDLDNTEILINLAAGPSPVEADDEDDIGASMFSYLSCAYIQADTATVHDMVCKEIAQLKDRQLRALVNKLAKCKDSERLFTNELLMFGIQSGSESAFKVLKAVKFVYQGLRAVAEGDV